MLATTDDSMSTTTYLERVLHLTALSFISHILIFMPRRGFPPLTLGSVDSLFHVVTIYPCLSSARSCLTRTRLEMLETF